MGLLSLFLLLGWFQIRPRKASLRAYQSSHHEGEQRKHQSFPVNQKMTSFNLQKRVDS